MGSSIGQAKVRPVSWDTYEKVEPFTEAVRKRLAIMKAQREKTSRTYSISGGRTPIGRRECCWARACRSADVRSGTIGAGGSDGSPPAPGAGVASLV